VGKADVLKLFEKQNGVCPYTGSKLIVGKNPSIDHIKPRAFYPELFDDIDNIQLVDKRVNALKKEMSEDELIRLVYQIYNYRIKPNLKSDGI
jgi:CRISPR/Cas system Type II protein with McrA/HNH and RuvC-like nuclease domain